MQYLIRPRRLMIVTSSIIIAISTMKSIQLMLPLQLIRPIPPPRTLPPRTLLLLTLLQLPKQNIMCHDINSLLVKRCNIFIYEMQYMLVRCDRSLGSFHGHF